MNSFPYRDELFNDVSWSIINQQQQHQIEKDDIVTLCQLHTRKLALDRIAGIQSPGKVRTGSATRQGCSFPPTEEDPSESYECKKWDWFSPTAASLPTRNEGCWLIDATQEGIRLTKSNQIKFVQVHDNCLAGLA